MMTQNTLIGVRDPYGIRPLVIGKLKNSYVLASETCAFDIIGAKFIREVENGEIVIITKSGLESTKPFPKMKIRYSCTCSRLWKRSSFGLCSRKRYFF